MRSLLPMQCHTTLLSNPVLHRVLWRADAAHSSRVHRYLVECYIINRLAKTGWRDSIYLSLATNLANFLRSTCLPFDFLILVTHLLNSNSLNILQNIPELFNLFPVLLIPLLGNVYNCLDSLSRYHLPPHVTLLLSLARWGCSNFPNLSLLPLLNPLPSSF